MRALVVNTESYSDEAKKLIELAGDISVPVDLQAILKDHPELIKGLNEFIAWREHEAEKAKEAENSSPIGHEISQTVKKIRDEK